MLVGADHLSDLRGQLRDALGFIKQAAELVLKDYAAQTALPRGERCLFVIAEEKGGIAQARSDDALVAGDHFRGLLAIDIGYRNKRG